MRLVDIDRAAVRRVVQQHGREFRTKEFADSPSAKQAHAMFTEEVSYNSMIGRALSRWSDDFGVELVDRGNGNARWRRL